MDIKEIQSRLKTLKLYQGAIDGISGKNTIEAIKAFQKSKGLTPDGIVGKNTTAQLLLIDTREQDFIDDPAPPSKIIWPRQADVPTFYGKVGENQTTLVLPYQMYYDGKPVTKFSVHKKVHDSALRIFQKTAETYNERERHELGLDQFSGCLNVRSMRGGTRYSMHSWGIAIDLDADRNQFKWGKDKARLARPDAEPFWKIVESEGWVSLGRACNYDWMHFQAARL